MECIKIWQLFMGIRLVILAVIVKLLTSAFWKVFKYDRSLFMQQYYLCLYDGG